MSAHVHAWDPLPLAWYERAGRWIAAYRCRYCTVLDERPVAGPGQVPEGT